MDFNNLFFPAPKSSYDASSFPHDKGGGLLWVPGLKRRVPCLLIKYPRRHKVLLFFHGNAEDVGQSEAMMRKISKVFHVSHLSNSVQV